MEWLFLNSFHFISFMDHRVAGQVNGTSLPIYSLMDNDSKFPLPCLLVPKELISGVQLET